MEGEVCKGLCLFHPKFLEMTNLFCFLKNSQQYLKTEMDTLGRPEIIIRNPEICKADGIMLTEKNYYLKMEMISNALLTLKG